MQEQDLRNKFYSAARESGFSVTSTQGRLREEFLCKSGDGPELTTFLVQHSDQSEIYFFPFDEEHLQAYTPAKLVELFSAVCMQISAFLGRTFSITHNFGTVKRSEITGGLEFLDWYQYLSPSAVNHWGIEYLRNGPFYKLDEYSNGACGIWLAETPDMALKRTLAAEYLSIKLPKLMGKNPRTGEPMEIAWS